MDGTRRPEDGPPWAWRFALLLVINVLRWIYGWRMKARRPARMPPPDEPLVVVYNHTSNVDPFCVAHSVWKGLGHWVQPMAKAELFEVPVLGTVARAAGVIPVERGAEAGREAAFGSAIDRLRAGGTVLLAPEGTITHDGTLLPLRHGAARMALDAGVDVLCVTHFGAQRGFSPVVRGAQRGVRVDLQFDVISPWPDEDATSLTGRIAATMIDRSAELQERYSQADPDAAWWPPYKDPAEPSSHALENLDRYRESMAEADEHARERMAHFAEEHEVEERLAAARARAEELAEHARERAEELAVHARERAAELEAAARERAASRGWPLPTATSALSDPEEDLDNPWSDAT